MLSDVYLYGELGAKYGRKHRFDVANAAQAAKALAANFKGFFADFRDGNYHVWVGDDELDETEISLRSGGRDIHIIPVIAGAKRGGGMKVVAGIALLAIAATGAGAAIGPFAAGTSGFSATAFSVAGFNVSWGSLASAGISLALNGISSLLTPTPKAGDYGQRNPVDQRASYLFTSATNRSAEGTAIPIVCGRFRVGTVVASAGITVEQLLST